MVDNLIIDQVIVGTNCTGALNDFGTSLKCTVVYEDKSINSSKLSQFQHEIDNNG